MTDSIPSNNRNKTAQKKAEETQTKSSSGTQWKTLVTLGAATVLVTSQLASCGADASAIKAATEEAAVATATPGGEGEGEGIAIATTADAGEGMGEVEGMAAGEGEGAATEGADFSKDDAAYLTQLGLIRGHLQVGYELYKAELPDLAETHMKHPRAEIYSALESAFKSRGCAGFADGLIGLTEAVSERQGVDAVSKTYNKLLEGIMQCETTAAIDDPKVAAKVIENLLRTAGVEYKIGVIDGEIDNLHEYQDAWGFTQVAQQWAKSDAFKSSAQAQEMTTQAQHLITEQQSLWPSLNPQGSIDGDAARLFGVAARIQVLALSLDES